MSSHAQTSSLDIRPKVCGLVVSSPCSRSVRRWLPSAVPLALFSILWLNLVRELSFQWSTKEQYAFGWFVPLLALDLFWRRWTTRPIVPESGPVVSGRVVSSPVVSGPWSCGPWSVVVLAAAAMLLPVQVLCEANPDWPLCSWLIALLVVGLSLYAVLLAGGWRWVLHFAFPICFILVAVSWPYRIEHGLTQGLMRAVTALTVTVLGWVDILASQHGNVIEISTGVVGIDEACSGIRSFQSMIMGALFLGELYRLRWPHRLALIGSGVVVAFGLNVVRTLILTWRASDVGIDVVAKWHDPAGISIFLASFACLWFIAWRIKKHCDALEQAEAAFWGVSPSAAPSPAVSASPQPSPFSPQPSASLQVSGLIPQPSLSPSVPASLGPRVPGSRSLWFVVSGQSSVVQSPNSAPQPSAFSPQPFPSRPLVPGSLSPLVRRLCSVVSGLPSPFRYLLALGCWSVCCVGLTELWYVAHERVGKQPQQWYATLPATNSTFQTVELTPQVLAALRNDEDISGTWRQQDGTEWTVFFLRWNPKSVPSIIRARGHCPDVCLPAAGFREVSNLPIEYLEAGPLKLPFQRYIYEANRQLLYVFFCLLQDGDEDQRGMRLQKGQRVLGVAERVQLARQGKRRLGQQTLEIVVSGCESFQRAEQQVREHLPGMICLSQADQRMAQNTK